MDAATLYMVLTMQDGTQTTSSRGYPSLRACAAGMEFLKDVARADRQGPIDRVLVCGKSADGEALHMLALLPRTMRGFRYVHASWMHGLAVGEADAGSQPYRTLLCGRRERNRR